ncbi:hypothetical protein [Nonomuraea sp. NPDC002799]
MERARQLVGEMLIYCFVLVLLTGGFLTFFYTPGGQTVVYDGSYEPLRGVMMSTAYDSALKISFDVRGGLLMRQLHHQLSVLLTVGAVVWVMLGRFRYGFALLGLGLSVLALIGGYGSADDLMHSTVLGRIPVLLWYGLHLAAALAIGAALVTSSRQEAARQPRTPGFVVLSIVLTAVLLLW